MYEDKNGVTYAVVGDSYSLGDVTATSIRYTFWDNRLTSISVKTPDRDLMLELLHARYGTPSSSGPAFASWELPDIDTNVIFLAFDDGDSLFFLGSMSLIEKKNNHQTDPSITSSPQRNIVFRDVAWRDPVLILGNHKLLYESDGEHSYAVVGDSRTFHSIQAIEVVYSFWEDQLISIFAPTYDWSGAWDMLISRYGDPSFGSMLQGALWDLPDIDTMVSYTHGVDGDVLYAAILLSSISLRDERDAADLNKKRIEAMSAW